MMARLVRAQEKLLTTTADEEYVEELYPSSRQVING
jgi:hypothetical protein